VSRHPHNFPAAAREALADAQLRVNLRGATQAIRARRAAAVAELPDYEELREQARRVKDDALDRLDELLDEFQTAAEAAGARVHRAPDAAAANAIVAGLARDHGVTELVKMKSLATDEIGLDAALAAAGVEAVETDLAELIVQLAGDTASHILVPAIHYSRGQVRDLFQRTIARGRVLSDDPQELAEVSRLYLRERFLRAAMGVTGANAGVAETGTVCVVENEGNGRMCTTLPPLLVTVMGIEKVVPTLDDLGLLLRLLPRSATGERMSSYASLLTGVTPGDGPREYHIVLLDNGRRNALADPVGRQALRCIRCSACLNVCPVYTRVGGHAYGSIYPGPIGAILAPQLWGMQEHAKLPFASSLCGACAEVCPVGIDIPQVLLHLRARAVREQALAPEKALFGAAAWAFGSPRRFAAAQKAGRAAEAPLTRGGLVRRLPPPLAGWSQGRDLRRVARETFRELWAREHRPGASEPAVPGSDVATEPGAAAGHAVPGSAAPGPAAPAGASEHDEGAP
jgi:L-lactate dehydrogenase complex protein LldF